MEVYVARQPVLDRNKKTYGYELLFREDMTNVFPGIDGDTATSKVLSDSFFSIGIEQITGGKKALINFTEELLIKKIPLMFPHEKVMVEVLEEVQPKKEVVIARQLAMYFAKGYTNLSLKSIGYHFGGRDHSTVIHAVQTVNDMYDVDSRFRSSVDELKKKLKMKSI